jgi:HK97 family phage portal protein
MAFRGILGRIFGKAATSDAVGSELFDAWGEWAASAAGVPVNALTALQHTAVMTCVSILAEDVAKLPIGLQRRLDNGGKARVRAKEHYLARLLRKPNAWQTRFEFIEMTMAALVLRSNAYAVILRDRNGFPQQLVPVHPDRVTLLEAPGGEWFYVVARQGLHEMAVLEDMPWMIAAEDMLHVRWLQTWHSLLGTSRVSLMRETIGLSVAQEQHGARMAGSGTRPSGVLQTDRRLSPGVADRIRESWQQSHGGWRNAGKTAVLEEGLQWKPLGMTMVDAEFMKSREFSLEDIARGFRVPHFKLGLTIERGDLVQLQQMYLNDVISSWCERLVPKFEELGNIDEDDSEYFVEFDYSHFLKADIQTRLTAMRTGVVGMIYTPNEARRGEGLADVPGGDTLYQPVNVAPIGFTPQKPGANGADSGPGSDTTGEPAPGGRGDGSAPAELPPDDVPSPSV